LLNIPRNDGAPPSEIGEHPRLGIQAKLYLLRSRVRTVAAETAIGENRPDITIEFHGGAGFC
jgi:hypothetical protein